jgi:magnesium chelatase accessory protein
MPDVPEQALPPWWPHRSASSFVDVGALHWHAQCFGNASAPVVLLLHGTGASAHSWRHLAPLLATHFRVIAPDLPGHAFTHTPAEQPLSIGAVAAALADLLRALDAQPTLVVGHSAGAAIALRMALDQPGAHAPIVAVNGAILPLQGPVGRWFLPLARLLAGNPLFSSSFAACAALPTMARRLLDGTGSRIDSLGERCYAHLLRDARHAAGALRLMASWDLASLQSALPSLNVRLLLLAASNDRTVSPLHAPRVARQVRSARSVALPGLGHLAHEEDASTVAALVMDHWRGAETGAPVRAAASAAERGQNTLRSGLQA